MTQTKVFQKILSVTLIGAFVMQQTGFVWAAPTNVGTWNQLMLGVVLSPGEYNVTTDLTASSTISVTENNTITGAKLSKGSATTLFNNSATLGLGNHISGSIVNNGTLNYSGASLADGSVTGTGTLAFLGTTVTNANTITQNAVSVAGTTTLTNNANITASTFTNNGTVDNNATIAAAITNAGTLSSTADNLNGAVTNTNTLTLEGGEVKGAISGTGNTTITADLTNSKAITQTSVTNSANLTNSGVITAAISNTSTGTIGSTADNLNGTIDNDGTLNLAGGTVQGAISSTNNTGITNISADLINNYTITQASVTNNANLTGTGKLNVTGDSVNSGSITQDLVTISNNATFNNNGMLLAKVSNASGSTLNSDPDHLGGDVANDGTLNLNDKGTLSVALSGEGATNIQKDLDNQGSISQKTINIQTGAVVTSNASDMTASDTTTGINNKGTIKYTGGATGNTVTGDGRMDITGYVTNTGDITQKTVSNSGVFTNKGTVTANLTNTSAIEGTGSITTGTGVSSNTGTIEQKNVTNAGTFDNSGHITLTEKLTNHANATFNTNADLISATEISNAGNLNITGGTNTNVITGDSTTTPGTVIGTTHFSNTVTNNAAITQGTVTNSGTLTNNALITAAVTNSGTLTSDGAKIAGAIANTGTYAITDGNNANAITGTGTTSILGTTANTGTITQDKVTIGNAGSLTTNADAVIAAITNEGTYNIKATDTADNKNAITGTGTLNVTSGTINNKAAIVQNQINITGGTLTSNADLLASVGGINNEATLSLTGGTNTNVITGTNGALTTTGDVINNVSITQKSVTIESDSLGNTGTITADDIIVESGAVLASEGDNIDGKITNKGVYALLDGDNDNVIGGTGNLQIFGNTTNTGTVAQDTITVASGASLVATDISNITTTTGIDNAGTLEMQTGTNNNAITGNTGALKVTGTVTNASGKNIRQDTIDIATLGNFTANAGDLNTVNGITNNGSLTLGDGATANTISGEGTLAVTGAVTNTGHMAQKSFTNTGTFTSDASLLAFAEGITNSNILNVTGGTNANTITGATGTTHFTNDVVNNAAIEQATVTNDTGTLTNNAAITAAFTNNGGTVNNEAAITGAITNTGTLNSTADNLVGTLASDGTLNIAGGTVQDNISGTGTLNITDDLTNTFTIAQATVSNSANMTNSGAITADFTNSGVLDNSADITGAITNTGTINSTATNLKGTIDNDGTLNLAGGTVQYDISSTNDTGITNITADLTNGVTIAQDTVNNSANLTNNAAINATTVTNDGTVTNGGTITATDIVNNGTISGAAADLIASNEIANAGTLVFNVAASTGASNISGNGNVEVTANTTLTGNNTYAGSTLLDGATLTVAGASNLGSGDVLFANNGVLALTAADTFNNSLKGQSATDDITVDNAAALTLNTATGAASDFHKVGTGTMTLAMASNGYTGNTYVDGGTLVGNTQNINNIVNGAAGTTVEFNDTTDADLNEINTLGTFKQSGSAVLNVQNNAFQAAQVELNAGTFAANRALNANVLNVNNGATLRGNGNVTGTVNVNNGGTVAPGNSIGTLTITGDANFNSGSTTAIEINETPASDKLIITGNANVQSGANLTVSNENGRYFEWKEFEIINAGNVSGEFTYDGTITDYDASRIDVALDYSDPTKVLLTAKRKSSNYAATTAGLSRNQGQAAKAMDAVSTGFGGDITNALLQLEKLGGLNPAGVTLINPNSTLKSALNDLDGVLYANSALTTLFNAKTAHVYDRISKRSPSAGACPTCHDNVWAEYYNQHDKVYANSNSPRFTNNMTGVLVGYDRSSDEMLLGVYGGAGKSDLRQSRDRMDVEDTSLGIYAGYMPGNWIFKGTLFGGYQYYHGKRNIDFMARSAEGKYHGFNVALDLEGGYNIALHDGLNLKPFVGVLGNYAHMESFTEKGADALNLHVESKNQFNTQARLGVQLDGKVGKKFNWYGSAAVKQFIGGDYAKLHMSLGLPGTRMEIISAELGRTYFSGQVGVSYALTNHWSLFGNLEAGVNNKSTNCYGNVGLAYTW